MKRSFKDNFSEISNSDIIYQQDKVPIFQNKVYDNEKEASEAKIGNVILAQSKESGFVFNSAFDPTLMIYDENYQNEQSNSSVFKEHLHHVLGLLNQFGISRKKVVEIGCGKAVFFNMLLKANIDCLGFDPTYEGDNPRIIKEYFSEEYSNINADVIIMRHTLEHIPNPFSFVHKIAQANNYKGMLFVEVPTFAWIRQKEAFWDIFFEHCNYFTECTLGSMFDDSITGNFFGGQYIYLWADLSKIRTFIHSEITKTTQKINFENSLKRIKKILGAKGTFAIWGAGAKGSTFLNLLDPNKERIKYVIDINPMKQNKFIACTAHPIYSPDILNDMAVDNILVMNENYSDEIKYILRDKKIEVFQL